MVDYQLSSAEKTFIIHGIQSDTREDGRSCDDYRHVEVTTGVISNANGSARLRLASTDVLVGIKAEVCTPSPDRADRGLIQCFVDCSANASPVFEGKGGDSLGVEIANCLTKAYEAPRCLDLRRLCIAAGSHVWKLNIDVVVLEFGGNVMDAVSIAVKAALHNTSLPNLTVSTDGGVSEVDVSDDPYDVFTLDVTNVPVIITLSKISHRHIVDATLKEEACSISRLTMAVTQNGVVTFTKTHGTGSLQAESIVEMLQTGKKVGQEMHRKLVAALSTEVTPGANTLNRQSAYLMT